MKQQLYEKLNNKAFAKKFYEKNLEKAKAYIFEITSVTSGVNVLVEGHDEEWGSSALLFIIELLTINHKNFSRIDFAEELTLALFDLSMEKSAAYDKWINGRFSYLDLNANFETIKKPEATVLDLSSQPENLDITAEQFSAIINKSDLPKEFQTILETYCEVKQ